MTMGPEPITRMCSMSLRRGISCGLPSWSGACGWGCGGARWSLAARLPGALHERLEPVEQVARVVRARRGLRVVLDRVGGPVEQLDPLDSAVVGAHVAHPRAPERRVELLAALPLEREAVVLRGDRHLARGLLDDRDVHPSVPEAHLVGAPAQRPAQDLIAEADSEHGDALADHAAREL